MMKLWRLPISAVVLAMILLVRRKIFKGFLTLALRLKKGVPHVSFEFKTHIIRQLPLFLTLVLRLRKWCHFS